MDGAQNGNELPVIRYTVVCKAKVVLTAINSTGFYAQQELKTGLSAGMHTDE